MTTTARIEIAGLGTGRIEQLSSFAQRYAEAINVRFIDFYRYAIFGQFGRKSNVAYMSIPRRLYTESMTTVALEWLVALSTLAKTTDTQYCTTLPFLGVISGRGLVSHARQWCPYCLEEMADSESIVYEPLIWCLIDSKCCAIHRTGLEDVCPICRRGEQNFFSANARVGCCRYCGAWLGRPYTPAEQSLVSDVDFNASLRCTDLLLLPQVLADDEALVPSRVAILVLRSRFFGGSSVGLAQAIGETGGRVNSYARGATTVPLSIFIRMALVTGASVRELLVAKNLREPTSNSDSDFAPRLSDALGLIEPTVVDSGVQPHADVGSGSRLRTASAEQPERSRVMHLAMYAAAKKITFVRHVNAVVAGLKAAGAPQPSLTAVKQKISSCSVSLNPWERMVIACSIVQAYAIGEAAISDGRGRKVYQC